MGAITERLGYGVPTGAPEIRAALLDLQFVGPFLGHVWLRLVEIVRHGKALYWIGWVSDRL